MITIDFIAIVFLFILAQGLSENTSSTTGKAVLVLFALFCFKINRFSLSGRVRKDNFMTSK